MNLCRLHTNLVVDSLAHHKNGFYLFKEELESQTNKSKKSSKLTWQPNERKLLFFFFNLKTLVTLVWKNFRVYLFGSLTLLIYITMALKDFRIEKALRKKKIDTKIVHCSI